MDHPAKTGLRRAIRLGATLAMTLTVFAGAAAGVYAGFTAISARNAENVRPVAEPVAVSVMQVAPIESYSVTRRFTGVLEAASRADLGFELAGRVTQVLVEEGDLVAAGDVIARLDTSALIPERAALEAELAALSADAELARLTLARTDDLTERGFRSLAAQDEARLALARAQAAIEGTRARIAGVDVRLEKSVLLAPFDARIGARAVDPGQNVAVGQSVVVLFDAAKARARVGLPAGLAAQLRVGDILRVTLDGEDVAARVSRIRQDLDPETRARPVILSLPAPPGAVFGETLTLSLEQTIDEPGFVAPLSALREGARGSWTVMAIEKEPGGDRAVPVAVEVIHTDGAQVVLRGALPDGARIIAQAADKIAPGESVRAHHVTLAQE